MGFISTLVVFNDYLHVIGADPLFGKKVESAVLHLSVDEPVWIGSEAIAIETHHNDGIVPVLVGHGAGKPLEGASVSWRSEDPELEVLKRLADKRGFRLVRKNKK